MHALSKLAIAAIFLTVLPGAKPDGPAVSLARIGKWEMNYDPESCHLLAEFGTGADRTVLNITRFQPGDLFDMTLYGDTVKWKGHFETWADVMFSGHSTHRISGYSGTNSKGQPLLMLFSLRLDDWQHVEGHDPDQVPPAIAPADEAAITSITFQGQSGQKYRLETGSLGAPLAAMRTCTRELVAAWGYDPDVQSTLSRPLRPADSPGRWVTNTDYPAGAVHAGVSGLINFRLDVDESGKPNRCAILHRTDPDAFSDISCKILLKRARFVPALDAQGKPVTSFFVSKFRWVIPE